MEPKTKKKAYQTKEIVICTNCNGLGKVPKPPEHCADDNYSLIDCPCCLNSGRKWKITTIKYEKKKKK